MKTFDTKEVALGVYLRFKGHYCIGTISANNKFRPSERLWMFEATDALAGDVAFFRANDPAVPVKETFYYYKVLKNLLNDKDEF